MVVLVPLVKETTAEMDQLKQVYTDLVVGEEQALLVKLATLPSLVLVAQV
jgi:hypothetical protein